MSRIARICALNYPHHITQRGNNKEIVFFENADREFYLKTLLIYSRKWSFDIWAYCLMPNHVHLLATPQKPESFAKGIGCTNLVYTKFINHKYKRSGRLWQNRFFSTIIDKESYLWATIRYIERNPVRAHLVERAEDYQWSSAKIHVSGIRDNIIAISGMDCPREWNGYAHRNFLKYEDKKIDTSIRKATSTGRPFGSEEFIAEIARDCGRKVSRNKVGRPARSRGVSK